MIEEKYDRRGFLGAAAGLVAFPLLPLDIGSLHVVASDEWSVIPKRNFWAPDLKSAEPTSSCLFIIQRKNLAAPGATACRIELSFRGDVLKKSTLSNAYLNSIRIAVKSMDSAFYLFTIREPQSLGIDSISLTFEFGKHANKVVVKPETYTHKTKLVFPFKGHGFLSQTWANDNGHKNGSSQFAIDALGVSENYAPQNNDDGTNESYAGWGRQLIAPAAGRVVKVQDGIPSQLKPDSMDPKSFTLPDGKQVSQGNHIVIDHGAGEFSTIMHMQPGSIPVKAGDPVEQGDAIGKLGNSGDTYGPHVHFQLTDGPDFAKASGLPCSFENVHAPLVRGQFFNAK